MDRHDDPAAYRSFVWFRTQTAQYAASELGYPQAEMVEAWAATPVDHQRAVLAAMTQVGVPYRTNTSQEGVGFDCSGLTTYAWSRAGVQLTRQSSAQIREAAPLDRSVAKAGDLVQYPGHVMMYLGVGDAVIHSVMSGRTVELDTINTRRTNSVRFGDPTSLVLDCRRIAPAPLAMSEVSGGFAHRWTWVGVAMSERRVCGRLAHRWEPARGEAPQSRMDGAVAVFEGRDVAAGAAGDDLGADRHGGLLGGAGSDVEPDR